MTIASFIPEVWSAVLLQAYRKSLVFGTALVNRDYEGEIANAGDTVHITSIGDPTIVDYASGGVLTYEDLTSVDRTLIVDQGKAFAFKVDDIDKRQAAGNVLTTAMSRAAYRLADQADQRIAGMYTQASAANTIARISVLTPTDAYNGIAKLGTRLTQANIPAENRVVVIPPWYSELLAEDTRFSNAYATGSPDAPSSAITGFVKRAAGFDIFVSNNVVNPVNVDWALVAGTTDAITFADQISQVEPLRLQSTFADAIRGLHVYGAKVVRPEALAVLIASQT